MTATICSGLARQRGTFNIGNDFPRRFAVLFYHSIKRLPPSSIDWFCSADIWNKIALNFLRNKDNVFVDSKMWNLRHKLYLKKERKWGKILLHLNCCLKVVWRLFEVYNLTKVWSLYFQHIFDWEFYSRNNLKELWSSKQPKYQAKSLQL